MKAKKLLCLIIISGAIILRISWFLVIKYHGENTSEEEELRIAEPIFLGCNIAICLSIILLILIWLLSKRKNLSNS
jgi:hypothetical protein